MIRHKTGFAPAGICYDPMTALMIVGTGMSLGSAYSSYENSEDQANSVAREGALKAKERAKSTMALASKQKVSFLNSGIALNGEGTPDSVMSNTYDTGLADIAQIKENYETQSSNIMSAARSKLLKDLGGTAMSVMGSGMFSGGASAGAGAGASGGLSGTMSGGGLTGSYQYGAGANADGFGLIGAMG